MLFFLFVARDMFLRRFGDTGDSASGQQEKQSEDANHTFRFSIDI